MSTFGLGEKIRNRRKYIGKNQGEVANKIPVSKSQISKWENENTYPSVSDFQKLCRAMNIHPADLIAGSIEADLQDDKEKKNKTVIIGVLAALILCLGITLNLTICRLKVTEPRQYEIKSLYSRLNEDGRMEVRQLIRPKDGNVWVDIVTYEKDGMILDYKLKEIVCIDGEIGTEHKIQLDEDGKRLVIYVDYQVNNRPHFTIVEIKPQN